MSDIKLEVTYSQKSLSKRCYGCVYLSGGDWFGGLCTNPFTRVKDKQRNALDKACVHKLTEHKLYQEAK